MTETCAADGCTTSIGLVTMSATPEALRRLGLPAGEEQFVARVCLRHYLVAMNEVLARAGLPRLVLAAKAADGPPAK